MALKLFIEIIKFPAFLGSMRPRITAMIILRRMARHWRNAELLDLEKSEAGQWCLQSLRSSVRELRIAAGRALGVFLSDTGNAGIDKDIIKRNRANALAILKTISEKEAPQLHETCILAWGQVGRVAADDELNLVLIKLLEYLGHGNTIVSAFAFSEIMNLADFRGVTPRQLFQPFWGSLAFSVVKDLVSKPQITRLVAELVQTNTVVLTRLLQKHALPWLVLTKKKDVIQKIAEARGEKETFRPCLDGANLPSILALLLVQDAPDVAGHSMELLRQVSPHFNGSDFVDLLRTDPLMISLELFKASGEANDARKAKVGANREAGSRLDETDVFDRYGRLSPRWHLSSRRTRRTRRPRSRTLSGASFSSMHLVWRPGWGRLLITQSISALPSRNSGDVSRPWKR